MVLMSIMFDLRQNNMYEKAETRITRANDDYIFYVTIPRLGLYAKSPYYIGGNMWNRQPVNIQNMNNKKQFKSQIRDLFEHL